MDHVIHWDEVEPSRREAGHIGGSWRDLGTAAGTSGVGVQRVDVDPGRWSTPAHVEGASEEIFYVLEGSGLSWQSGTVYAVRAGDCLVHLPHRESHTLRAGPDGLRVLAFGHRVRHGNTVLPRAGVAWMFPAFAEVALVGPDRGPYPSEAAAGEPEVGEPAERPASIVNVGDVDPVEREHSRSLLVERDLGRTAGSARTGLSHLTIPAGREGWPPHCHSAEEEIFVVLGGEGTVLLGDEEYPVGPGHIVGRPPGTRVAHAFRAGETELVYLAYGTREPNDIAYYPRSGKVNLRGVGVMGRIEPLGYWDGEP
ncbi:MAG: cupin domain-containing protein [Gaiellaceae bacterium]